MTEYKIGYFDDVVDIDDYIERNGEFISNSEVVDILNKLSNENEYLKQQINDIRLDWNQDYREFNKDTLYIEDHNTKIKLKDGRLYIEVFIPKLDEYFRFNYIVTGRKLEREYNIIKGDCDE